jgi:hypothetical protein
MARAIIEFTDAFPDPPKSIVLPIEVGSVVRSEVITIPTATQGSATTLSAAADEAVIDIYVEADCWVAIGSDPTAEANDASSRFMKANERRQFWAATGDKVSVVED